MEIANAVPHLRSLSRDPNQGLIQLRALPETISDDNAADLLLHGQTSTDLAKKWMRPMFSLLDLANCTLFGKLTLFFPCKWVLFVIF
jgi:hypothetical protein